MKKNQINTEKIISNIEKIVLPKANNAGLELVDIEYLQESGYWYVRIFVEKKDSDVSLEECANLSSSIEEEIDSLIPQKYFLEISSPGIERPLKKIEDFIKFKNKRIHVATKNKIGDKNSFDGLLIDCDGETIKIEIDKKIIEIIFSEIKKANLVFDFFEMNKM